eukprot:TRINITY_DN14584_c0_g1_i2.p2 TRINITY_DN14584_c0_g1~~TRINITY_DN14584_c0_g1_i2.p2  ORF type:complete len:110 (-),score=27.29 TRINITY_DN14584_c0_g1_i2:130-459(-)
MYPKFGIRIESIINIKKTVRKKHECIEIEFLPDQAMNFLKQKKFIEKQDGNPVARNTFSNYFQQKSLPTQEAGQKPAPIDISKKKKMKWTFKLDDDNLPKGIESEKCSS